MRVQRRRPFEVMSLFGSRGIELKGRREPVVLRRTGEDYVPSVSLVNPPRRRWCTYPTVSPQLGEGSSKEKLPAKDHAAAMKRLNGMARPVAMSTGRTA